MTDCTIEITGERKTGKTQAALSIAVTDAISGRHVLYTAGSQAAATEAIKRVIGMMPVAKSTITPGRQRTDTPTGGRIYFVARTANTGRGMTADTLILDDWDGNQRHMEDLIPALNPSRDPFIVIARSAIR